MKTKPTQYAVRTLNSTGIQPDFILARSSSPLDDVRKGKISIFCNINQANIISAPDVESIYDIPLNFENDKLGEKILKKLKFDKIFERTQWQDALEIINGKSQKQVLDPDGKYPIYGSGGIMGYANKYLSPENSVIIGRKGTINKPIKVSTKFWNVDTAFWISTQKEN